MITSACGTGTVTLDRIHHALYLKCREKAAREASPTACIIDSQSVKSAEKGGLASTATLLRCRQADQGQEAACSGRYARLAAARRSSPPPTFRIATAVSRCWRPCSVCFPFSGNCSPTAPIRGRSFNRALAGILPDLETEIVKRSDQGEGLRRGFQPRRWVWSRRYLSPGSTAASRYGQRDCVRTGQPQRASQALRIRTPRVHSSNGRLEVTRVEPPS